METSAEAAYLSAAHKKRASGPASTTSKQGLRIPAIASLALWPAIIALPLSLTARNAYKDLFREEWYAPSSVYWGDWPSPVGLTLGILAVVVGQIFMLGYHWLHVRGHFGGLVPVQREGAAKHRFWEACIEHLSQPEGFVMLGGYLVGTWMFNLMPASYYSFEGGIDWVAVGAQLLLQDAVQYLMHFGEHKIHMAFYRISHKPHHRFTNPKLFDAFNGSPTDTLCMILIPLFITSRVIHTNVWSYMTFGSLYANWLCLIHSEVFHPWDSVFRRIGFGTAADHHVHHKLFSKNYGHLFMYCDMLFSTYRNPNDVAVFNKMD